MKTSALLNAPVAGVVAEIGHGESLTVCDAGLPIPDSTQRIDLAVTKNVPGFLDTLRAIASEYVIERAIIAEEMITASPILYQAFTQALQEIGEAQERQIPLTRVKHERFKELSTGSRAIVRTGECTPYANVILVGGVNF